MIYWYFHYTGFGALSIMHKKIAYLNHVVLFRDSISSGTKKMFFFGGNPFHALFRPFYVFVQAFPRHLKVFPQLLHGHSTAHIFLWLFFWFRNIKLPVFFSEKSWNSQTSFLTLQFCPSIDSGFYEINLIRDELYIKSIGAFISPGGWGFRFCRHKSKNIAGGALQNQKHVIWTWTSSIYKILTCNPTWAYTCHPLQIYKIQIIEIHLLYKGIKNWFTKPLKNISENNCIL